MKKPFDAGDFVLEVIATEMLRQQSGKSPQTATAGGRRQAWNCAREMLRALKRSGLAVTGDADIPQHLTRTAQAEAARREGAEALREAAAHIADGYVCGMCGADGKAAAEIRALPLPGDTP